MATAIGKAYIYSLGVGTSPFVPGAIGIASLSGYVSPKLETLSLSQQAEWMEEKSQAGDIDAIIANAGGIECQFRFKPRGTTVAFAKDSAGIPQVGAAVTITSLPIIAFAGFTNALNTDGANSQPWLYVGSGSIEGAHDGIWTATFTLRRYLNITSGTGITLGA